MDFVRMKFFLLKITFMNSAENNRKIFCLNLFFKIKKKNDRD